MPARVAAMRVLRKSHRTRHTLLRNSHTWADWRGGAGGAPNAAQVDSLVPSEFEHVYPHIRATHVLQAARFARLVLTFRLFTSSLWLTLLPPVAILLGMCARHMAH